MNALPKPGAAIATHGAVSVEHHAATEEVVVIAPGHRMSLSDGDGRDLAACMGELFPSMCCGVGWYRGGPR